MKNYKLSSIISFRGALWYQFALGKSDDFVQENLCRPSLDSTLMSPNRGGFENFNPEENDFRPPTQCSAYTEFTNPT